MKHAFLDLFIYDIVLYMDRITIYDKKLNKIFARNLDLILTYKCSKVIIKCLENENLNVKSDDLFHNIKNLINHQLSQSISQFLDIV